MTEAVNNDAAVSIDVREIMRYLPHRYPFLLVDRVTEFVAMWPTNASRPSRT